MIRWIHIGLLLCLMTVTYCQCPMLGDHSYSNRIANHTIDLVLDHDKKMVQATQRLDWLNHSDTLIQEIPFYTYLNAFKNSKSTFIRSSSGNPFGQDLTTLPENEWGWIEIEDIAYVNGQNLKANLSYTHADGNLDDQTVMTLKLPEPIPPGELVSLDITFTSRLPKTIARVGYSKNFFLFVHWFPQPGVLEKNTSGEWEWNCRQGHRRTEFYNEFGTYDVSITCWDQMVIGASGCEVESTNHGNGTKTVTYHAEDVHSFAWTAYPEFIKYKDTWNHVDITLLSPPEHDGHALRFITAVKQSLEYLETHVGPYPYPTITIMNPPFHGLRSGFMEYPTFITTGSIAGFPTGITTIESLAVHEFAHQYFMGMIATNEKEEPWLDEGFVTYFEDEIMKTYYGEKTSLFDIFGYKVGNSELSRNEYVSLPNPSVGSINRPAWEFNEGRKGLIYSKTACVLNTLKNYLGQDKMDEIMKSYFQNWSFKHPKSVDCFDEFKSGLYRVTDSTQAAYLFQFFDKSIQTTATIDYAVARISNAKMTNAFGLFGDIKDGFTFTKGTRIDSFTNSVTVYKFGDLNIPTEVEIIFEDGSKILEPWNGNENSTTFTYYTKQKIISAAIDPRQKIMLDLDFNNNSKTLAPNKSVLYKYGIKALNWVQNTLHSVTFLI